MEELKSILIIVLDVLMLKINTTFNTRSLIFILHLPTADSLQEVRLPVISSRECQRRSIFLPAYRITPNMFCAGYDRGGRDACLVSILYHKSLSIT